MTQMDTTTALAVLVRRFVTVAVLGVLVALAVALAANFLGWVGWPEAFGGFAVALWWPGVRFVLRVGRRLGALP